MIYDRLENLEKYKGIAPNLDTVIDFLIAHNPFELPMGLTEIDGDCAWLTRHTNPMRADKEALWERHQQYIDLQLGLKDGETIDYLPEDCLNEWEPWKADLQLSKEYRPGIHVPLKAGTFMIFFCMELHRPAIGEGNSSKVVCKIRA